MRRFGTGQPLLPAWLVPEGTIISNRHGTWVASHPRTMIGLHSHIRQPSRRCWKADVQ